MSTNDNNMKNDNPNNSDIKNAADNVDVEQLDKNLHKDKSDNEAEDLKAEEQTPFIDKSLRTDE